MVGFGEDRRVSTRYFQQMNIIFFQGTNLQVQQQQQPSLIPLSGVGYMDQITP